MKICRFSSSKVIWLRPCLVLGPPPQQCQHVLRAAGASRTRQHDPLQPPTCRHRSVGTASLLASQNSDRVSEHHAKLTSCTSYSLAGRPLPISLLLIPHVYEFLTQRLNAVSCLCSIFVLDQVIERLGLDWRNNYNQQRIKNRQTRFLLIMYLELPNVL